jgi:poly(3-hydroxybutyrate) depolymerase
MTIHGSVPAACPPLPGMRLTDGLDTWRAAFDGVTEYWAGAIARRATPVDLTVDLLRFWQAATERRRPRWHMPHAVAFETPIARLRDFSQGEREGVPTLVLPPQAGHDSCIVDYSPEQSQLGAIREAGLRRVASLDWIGATQATRDASIEDYLAVIDRAVDHLGGRVNLIGDCQGGWLAAVWAALNPDAVHTLTLAGAPIDFHAGDGAISGYVEALDPSFYESLVAMGGGVLKGEYMLGGFILIRPDGEIAKHAGLLASIHDPVAVERYRQFEDWYKHTQDIPGVLYLWIVEHLFRGNALIRGELEIAGRRVDLARIACPLNLLAGAADHITPPAQVMAAAGAVSTPPERIVQRIAPGGHLGLFMGRAALRDDWAPLLRDIAQV